MESPDSLVDQTFARILRTGRFNKSMRGLLSDGADAYSGWKNYYWKANDVTRPVWQRVKYLNNLITIADKLEGEDAAAAAWVKEKAAEEQRQRDAAKEREQQQQQLRSAFSVLTSRI